MDMVLLYLAGLALLFMELFVPGAILGLVGFGMMLWAIVATAIKGDWALAGPFVVATVIAIPLMIRFALRRLSLDSELSSEEGFAASEQGLDELAGSEGLALTALRPSGMARFDGRKVSVVAETGLIEAETQVRVVRVEGNRVVVRPC